MEIADDVETQLVALRDVEQHLQRMIRRRETDVAYFMPALAGTWLSSRQMGKMKFFGFTAAAGMWGETAQTSSTRRATNRVSISVTHPCNRTANALRGGKKSETVSTILSTLPNSRAGTPRCPRCNSPR